MLSTVCMYCTLVKITFAPICECKNSRWRWRHDASTTRSHDLIDQLWWHHNAKSEKDVLSDNGEISDRWVFLSGIVCKKWNSTFVTVNDDFFFFWSFMTRFANDVHSWLHHSWKSLTSHITHDQKIIIHGNSCIILYNFYGCWFHGYLVVLWSGQIWTVVTDSWPLITQHL